VRAIAILPVTLLGLVLAAACGDDSNGGSGNSPTQPASCGAPCMVGTMCYQPDPSSNCNGDWYCWSDSLWHCAPPDSGGPGDATVTFDTGGGGDDASEEAPVLTDAGPG
jgi:hypothetical protein